MGFEKRTAGARRFDSELDFEGLLRSAAGASSQQPGQQSGPRARRRASRARLAETGAVAALLGLQGCMTVGKDGASVAPPPPPPAAGSGQNPDTAFPIAENGVTEIAVAHLLASQPGAKTIVEITGAENGVAQLHGAVVHFTPNPGYSGPASISFTYRDEDGNLRTGKFHIDVDDEKAAEHNHDGGHGGGHDGGHDGHDGGQSDGGHGGHGGRGGGTHTDDPAMQAEHMALMALVAPEDATHVAVKNGSWFDPSTWSSGKVPGDGAKVFIPEGMVVNYDGESQASLFTVRVDGEMHFARDRDTFMEVDTFVIAPGGYVTIGTAANPVAAHVRSVISIADNGPIDVAWDPMLLSRGLISNGDIEIHGAQKDSFIRLAADAMKGDTKLTLESPPEGWRVGDKLVLTGTKLTSASDGTQDEELIIKAINGNVITLNKALQYDHDAPRGDLKAYVANYTRNVRIESEGGDSLPVHERGHVMFMHSDRVDVRYAEFTDLGRTDKSVRGFDIGDLDTVSFDSNVKGRYSLHVHRTGYANLDEPAMLVGNAVWGSPSWGFVHHDSNAVFAQNAAYNVFGAAFVAESGNETGRWVDNIAIKSIGISGSIKDAADIAAFDLARTGTGFWFQGRLVDAIGNVAAGMPDGHGFVYMHRGDGLKVDPLTVRQGEKLRYLDDVLANQPNIGQFANNESIAARTGAVVVKEGPRQLSDVRTVFEDFTAWEVRTGINLEYTGHYTLRNIDIVGADIHAKSIWAEGIKLGTNAFDVIIVGANIENIGTGVRMTKESLLGEHDFGYVFIGVDFRDVPTAYVGLDGKDRVLGLNSIVDRQFVWTSDHGEVIFSGPATRNDAPLILSGVKTDSLGPTVTSPTWDPFKITFDSLRGAVEQNGYWSLPNGRKVTMVEEYVSDRITGELHKYAVFVEVPSGLNLTPGVAKYTGVRTEIDYNGLLDLNSAAPVAGNDAAKVKAGRSVVIDVLANDWDPDGDDIRLDGVTGARHGHVTANKDGTVSYVADPGFSGVDKFHYWTADEHGNFTKAMVTVTVEI